MCTKGRRQCSLFPCPHTADVRTKKLSSQHLPTFHHSSCGFYHHFRHHSMEDAHRDKRVCVEGVSSQASDGSQHPPQIEGGEDDGHAADIEEYQWKDPIKQTYSEVVQSMTQLFNDFSQLQKAVVQTQKSVSRMKECDPQFGESDLQSLLQSSFLVLQHEVSGLQRSISRLQETAAKTTAGEQVSPMLSRPVACLKRHSHHTYGRRLRK
jgi:hypothetical protein